MKYLGECPSAACSIEFSPFHCRRYCQVLRGSSGNSVMLVSLVIQNGDRRGERVNVCSSRLLVGRHDRSDLQLSSDRVSRRHCLITLRGEEADIEDLGSRNGTLVNGRKLQKGRKCSLRHHDEIRVGPWRMRISMRDTQSRRPIPVSDRSTLCTETPRGAVETCAGKQTDRAESGTIPREHPEPPETENGHADGEPGRLPDHLKRSGPSDSTAAASEALRRHFGR